MLAWLLLEMVVIVVVVAAVAGARVCATPREDCEQRKAPDGTFHGGQGRGRGNVNGLEAQPWVCADRPTVVLCTNCGMEGEPARVLKTATRLLRPRTAHHWLR